MKKAKSLICLLVAVLLALPQTGCAFAMQRYNCAFTDCFDTVVMFSVFTKSEEAAIKLENKVHERLLQLHKLFDIYHEYDGIVSLKTVNDNAAAAPVAVSGETMSLLEFAKDVCELTDGTVNCAMGSVLSLWHDCRMAAADDPSAAKLPDYEALRLAAEHTDMNCVMLDQKASTVFFADSELKLDVGAVAKGFAAQLVIDELEAEGYDNILLNLGGNTCTLGKKPNGEPWNVVVQNPFGEGYIAAVGLESQSLVTSGDYQRYFTVDGKDYNHIIDPETLTCAENFSSVSVKCGNSALADALSTALFIMNYEDGLKLVNSIGGSGAQALWVKKDGTELETKGFITQ